MEKLIDYIIEGFREIQHKWRVILCVLLLILSLTLAYLSYSFLITSEKYSDYSVQLLSSSLFAFGLFFTISLLAISTYGKEKIIKKNLEDKIESSENNDVLSEGVSFLESNLNRINELKNIDQKIIFFLSEFNGKIERKDIEDLFYLVGIKVDTTVFGNLMTEKGNWISSLRIVGKGKGVRNGDFNGKLEVGDIGPLARKNNDGKILLTDKGLEIAKSLN